MTDYTIFYKSVLPSAEDWPVAEPWDLLISAFNCSDRVQTVFRKAVASEKHWLIIPEYGLDDSQCPTETDDRNVKVFRPKGNDEGEFIRDYWHIADLQGIVDKKLCLDITGFPRPHLLFLLRYLMASGVKRLDVLYAEPQWYRSKENTKFSGNVVSVRQIAGYQGVHVQETSHDLLILGVGYEHELAKHVVENKKHPKKVQLFGLPSLRADMYQESVLGAELASDSVGISAKDQEDNFFAPANDPFVTASVLQQIVESRGATNLYLCPLGTKAQALGFAIYYLTEWIDRPASLIFPLAVSYLPDDSMGVSRIWKYVVELPAEPS